MLSLKDILRQEQKRAGQEPEPQGGAPLAPIAQKGEVFRSPSPPSLDRRDFLGLAGGFIAAGVFGPLIPPAAGDERLRVQSPNVLQTREVLPSGIIPVSLVSTVSGVRPGERMAEVFTTQFLDTLARTSHLRSVMGSTPEQVRAYLQDHNWVLPPDFLLPVRMGGRAFHSRVEYKPPPSPVDLSRGVVLNVGWGQGPNNTRSDVLNSVVWSGNEPGYGGMRWHQESRIGRLRLDTYIKHNDFTSEPMGRVVDATWGVNVALGTLMRMQPIDENVSERLGREFELAFNGTSWNPNLLVRQGLFDDPR